MSGFQQAYLVAMVLLAYPAWRAGNRYVCAVLWANFIAILAACLAADLAMIDANSRFGYFLVIDLCAGAALVVRPGMGRVVSIGYAFTVPLYLLIISGFLTQDDAPVALICFQAAIQLGVLGLGSFGGNGGGGGRRLPSREVSLAIPQRGAAMAGGPISAATCDGQG